MGLTVVVTGMIKDLAVTAAKLANLTVTGAKIAAATITGDKIAMGSDAQGDILYYNGSAYARLGAGTANYPLVTNGAGANPAFEQLVAAGLATGAVTGPKIAMGSDAEGDILYRNGSNYVRLGKGTAGQHLAMNSGATAPEWVTPGVEFVSVTAISAAATVVKTGLEAGYDYIFGLHEFSPTDDAETLYMRLSDDAGVSYEEGGTDYGWGMVSGGSGANDPQDSELELFSNVAIGNDTNSINSVEVTLINPVQTDTYKTLLWSGLAMNTASPQASQYINGGGVSLATGTVNAVQFLWSGGSTFKAQGNLIVWRRKRS